MRRRGSYRLTRASPESTTDRTHGRVSEVSATLVARITRGPFGSRNAASCAA